MSIRAYEGILYGGVWRAYLWVVFLKAYSVGFGTGFAEEFAGLTAQDCRCISSHSTWFITGILDSGSYTAN